MAFLHLKIDNQQCLQQNVSVYEGYSNTILAFLKSNILLSKNMEVLFKKCVRHLTSLLIIDLQLSLNQEKLTHKKPIFLEEINHVLRQFSTI